MRGIVHFAEYGCGAARDSLFVACYSPDPVPDSWYNHGTQQWIFPRAESYSLDAEDTTCVGCLLRHHPRWIVKVVTWLVWFDTRIRLMFAV